MEAALTTILGLVQNVLPLLTKGSATVSTIGSIVDVMTTLAPIIKNEVSTVGTVAKNIIAAVQSNPATTDDQLAALQALDKQVDDAFEAAAADVDPDL